MATAERKRSHPGGPLERAILRAMLYLTFAFSFFAQFVPRDDAEAARHPPAVSVVVAVVALAGLACSARRD